MRVAPGRKHDLLLLEKRLSEAKTEAEKHKVMVRVEFLRKEGKDPVMHKLRERLLNAARAGDNKAGDEISEQIYRHVNKGK